MSLKKFQEKNKKKNQIIIFTIVCILLIAGVVLYQSYALFEAKDHFNVVSGSIENPGDLSFAFYVNDEIVLEAPSKESNLALSEKSNCNNGVTVSWNVESWNASVNYSNYKQENTSKTKCNLFFREAVYSDYITSCGENGNTAVDCMKKYSDKDTINLAYDETEDNNLRYIGSNPNNYVSFNNELWRIIGVMENIDDGTGKKDARIKLIREEPIGKYSWDSSPSNINGGYGVNEWSVSDLNVLLNDMYYNQKSGQCYIGENDAIVSCSFEDKGLKNVSKQMFSRALWSTGANSSDYTILTANDYYSLEKSNNTGKVCSGGAYCNDTISRTTKWTGLIGLPYMSDYVFATSGDATMPRSKCFISKIYEWNLEENSSCRDNDWFYNPEWSPWFLSPFGGHPVISHSVFHLTSTGRASTYAASSSFDVVPTLYLNSSIIIRTGAGRRENPYQLFLN